MAEIDLDLPASIRFEPLQSVENPYAGDTLLDIFYGTDLASGSPPFSDAPYEAPPNYSPSDYNSPSPNSDVLIPSEGISTSEDDSSSLHRVSVKAERPILEKFDIASLQEHSRKRFHGN